MSDVACDAGEDVGVVVVGSPARPETELEGNKRKRLLA
jgi:hypothetical protein